MHVCHHKPLPKNDHANFNYTTADTASPDDPDDLSFSRGDILHIIDNADIWWRAETEDGTRGSMSYLLTDSNACSLILLCSCPIKLFPNRRQPTARVI